MAKQTKVEPAPTLEQLHAEMRECASAAAQLRNEADDLYNKLGKIACKVQEMQITAARAARSS